MRSSDLLSDCYLDSIRNSCDVFIVIYNTFKHLVWRFWVTLLYPNDNHNNDLQSVEDTLLKDNRLLTENENEQKS